MHVGHPEKGGLSGWIRSPITFSRVSYSNTSIFQYRVNPMNMKRKRLLLTTISLLILCLSYIAASPTPTQAANPAANLDQCANGGVGKPPIQCAGSAWVNGDLNPAG